jgi:hypothetical protein
MQTSRPRSPIVPAVERPLCAKCGTYMWLSLIEPDKPGHDHRTFECPRCQHETAEVVKFR